MMMIMIMAMCSCEVVKDADNSNDDKENYDNDNNKYKFRMYSRNVFNESNRQWNLSIKVLIQKSKRKNVLKKSPLDKLQLLVPASELSDPFFCSLPLLTTSCNSSKTH
jgi:hypothetical protein